MSADFQREYLVRLSLPLAQLYCRAYNDKDARSRHNNTFYLFESLIKLAVAPRVAAYLQEVEQGAARIPSLDQKLAKLALPSLGHWMAMLRELARHFGARPDAATHPLGNLWKQLDGKRRDLPAVLDLYRRIKNGTDGQLAGDQSCSPLQLLEALVQYRNDVFGHGGERFASFYEREMGPLLFPAVNELLADGALDLIGPPGSRLIYLTEVRTVAEGQVQVGLRELVGLQGERMTPLELSSAASAALVPNTVAVLWPGRLVPLRLDPLLIYRDVDVHLEVLFLNGGDQGTQAEYLSYTTGRREREEVSAAAMAALLGKITGDKVRAEDIRNPNAPAEPFDYQILGEIGRGGMGVVYLAKQLSLGRLVALKMLPPELAADEVALARFRREIRHLARCEHPHIVKVLSSGKMPEGDLFYTMEYVPGCDLEAVWRELSGLDREGGASSLGSTTWSRAVLTASRKQRDETVKRSDSARRAADPTRVGMRTAAAPRAAPATDSTAISPFDAEPLPLPPLPQIPAAQDDPGGYVRRVAAMIRDVAGAVQMVHDQQVVHRDIKPANLMLTPDGQRVVLMDFGLAKGQTMGLTSSRHGGLLGTLRYASPEQLAAASCQVGAPADVRGLGVTLWEMLTRRQLFGEAQDETQLAHLVLNRDVPRLRSIDPTIDRDLEAIVARATDRDAGARIQTAGRLAEYLQNYLDGKPIPIRTPTMSELAKKWVGSHKAWVATIAAAVATIVLTVIVAFIDVSQARTAAETLATQKSDLADRNAKLAEAEKQSLRRVERQVRISDSHRLAMAARAELNQHPARSLLLATEAMQATLRSGDPPTPAARSALVDVVQGVGGEPLGESLGGSDDDGWVLTKNPKGGARLWDTKASRLASDSIALRPDPASEETIIVSNDGRWIAAMGKDQQSVAAWPADAKDISRDTVRMASNPYSFALSPNGRWLVSVSGAMVTHAEAVPGQVPEPLGAVSNPPVPAAQATPASEPAALAMSVEADSGAERPAKLADSGITPEGVQQTSPPAAAADPPAPAPTFKVLLYDLAKPASDSNPHTLKVIEGERGPGDGRPFFDSAGRWLIVDGGRSVNKVFFWDIRQIDRGLEPRVAAGSLFPSMMLDANRRQRWIVLRGETGIALVDLNSADPTAAPRKLEDPRAGAAGFTLARVSPDGRWLAAVAMHSQEINGPPPAAPAPPVPDAAPAPDAAPPTPAPEPPVPEPPVPEPPAPEPPASEPPAKPAPSTVPKSAEKPPNLCIGNQEPAPSTPVEPLKIFNPPERVAGALPADCMLFLWDLNNAAAMAAPSVLVEQAPRDNELSFSGDSRILALAGNDGVVRAWSLDADGRGVVNTLLEKLPPAFPLTIEISPNGRWLFASGGTVTDRDYAGRLWDLSDNNPNAPPKILRGHQVFIEDVVFSADGSHLMTLAGDEARRWDLTTVREPLPALSRPLAGRFAAAMVSSDGHWLLTDGNGSAPAAASPDRDDQRPDGSQLWDLTGAEPKARLKTARGQTTDDKAATVVGFSHDGKRLVCGYRGGEIHVWSLDQPEVEATVKSFSGFKSAVAGFAVSRDGKTLAAGGEDGTVCLWALSASAPATSKTAIGRIDAPADRLAFSPDGRTIAAASTTIERRGAARELKSADATKHLAEALPPQKVRLWTIQPDGTAASLTTLKETVGGIQQLSFNEAGTRLIALVQQPKPAPGQSPYVTQMALEWSIDPAGPTVPVAVDEQGNFGRSELSSDGRWLVAGGYPTDEPTNVLRGDPATARLWDLQVMASRKASVLFGFGDEVIDDMPEFVFSLDGRGLAAVSNNRPILADDLNDHERVVRVYDLGRGDIRSPEAIVLRVRGPAITQAAVNSDGRRLITMSADHTVRIWDLDDEHLISLARRTAGRGLTDEERSMYLLESP